MNWIKEYVDLSNENIEDLIRRFTLSTAEVEDIYYKGRDISGVIVAQIISVEKHPDSKVALQEWATIVKRSEWTCFADIKKTFNTVDNVGNQHYVFNIKGNTYRLVVVIKFTIKFVYIRFIGTHKEYDKIDYTKI